MKTQSRLQTSSVLPQPSVPSGLLQRKCASCGNHTVAGDKCDGCKNKNSILQRKSSNNSKHSEVPPIVSEVLNSSGQPLDKTTRVFFESRFEHNFSQVPISSVSQQLSQSNLTVGEPADVYEQEADRIADSVMLKEKHENKTLSTNEQQDEKFDLSRVRVHTDARAAESARSVNALAYTVGHNIVFGAGQFAPETHRGRCLIAHELTHVAQQSGSDGIRALQRDLATPPLAVPAAVQPDLTPVQIQEAINFNRARYNEANTRLIQNLLGGPVTGIWTADNIEAIAATQEEYGLNKDGKVGDATFRFLNREQSLEGMTTSTANCLTSFRVDGPDAATFVRETPTRCRFGGHFRTESQFSNRCTCSQFQYRQFIRGQFTRTRGGVVTDFGTIFAIPGGGLPAAFAEDGDTAAAALNYGHREQPSEGALNHYIDNTGADDMANGCRYASEDFPFARIEDCLPGDSYDVDMNFRGEIQRNGTPIQRKFWTAIRRNNWTP